jgi:hypothetical protein
MRRFLCVSSLCVLALSQVLALDPEQKVTYEVRASRIPVILGALSTTLETKLTVDPILEREVLAIKVKDVTAKSLMDKIAETLGAEWIPSTTGFKLDRSKDLQTSLAKADSNTLLSIIKAEIQKTKENPNARRDMFDLFGGEAPGPEVPQVDPNQTPEQKEMAEITKEHGEILKRVRLAALDEINAEAISNLIISGRIVWATKPNSKQKTLSNTFVNITREANTQIAKLRTRAEQIERKLEEEAAKKAPGESKPEPPPGQFVGEPTDRAGDDFPYISYMLQPLDQILIIAERQTPYSFVVTVKSEFDTLDYLGIELEGNRYEAIMEQVAEVRGGEAPKKKPYTPSITLKNPKKEVSQTEASKVAQSIASEFGDGAGAPDADKISNALNKIRGFYNKPDEIDPLSNAATQSLFEIATDQNANMVAYIPDSAFMLENTFGGAPANSLEKALRSLDNIGSVTLSSQDGWVTGKMRFPSISPLARLDRVVARKVGDEEAKNGSLSLATRITFAQSYPDYSQDLMNALGYLIFPSMMAGDGGFMGRSAFTGLRFYGSLTPPQKDVLHSGTPLPYRTLQANQQLLFLTCLTGFEDLERTKVNRGGMFDFLESMSEDENSMGAGEEYNEDTAPRQSPFRDRSDAEPFLMTEGFAFGSFDEEKVISPAGPKNTFFPVSEMNAKTFAALKAMMTSKTFKEMEAFMPKFDKGFFFGTKTNLNMSFAVKGYGARQSVSDSQMGKTALQENQLPADFLAEVKAAYEKMLKGVERMDSYGEERPTP